MARVERRPIPSRGPLIARELAEVTMQALAEPAIDAKKRILTGLTRLDSATGGFGPGDVVLVGAQPAMGLSMLVQGFCLHAARGGRGAFLFSPARDSSVVGMSLLSAASGVFLSKLRKHDLKDADWVRLSNASVEMVDLPLFVDTHTRLTVAEIREAIAHIAPDSAPELVVIDGLRWLTDTPGASSRTDELRRIGDLLKRMAFDLQIAIVVASDLPSTVSFSSNPRLLSDDFGELRPLIEFADAVLLLNRPEYWDMNDRPGEADLRIALNREGPTLTVPLLFEGHLSRFSNLHLSAGENRD